MDQSLIATAGTGDKDRYRFYLGVCAGEVLCTGSGNIHGVS